MIDRLLFARGLRLTAACAALVLAPTVLAQTPDYTTIPPEPAEVEQKLTAAHVTLAQAIAAAEKASNGHAVEAKAMTAGEKVSYEIYIESQGMLKRAIVDGTSGEVKTVTLTTASAIEKASAAVKGAVRSVVFDLKAEPPVATVMIYNEGKAHKVVLNAETGAVVSNEATGRFPGEASSSPTKEMPSGLQYIDLKEGTGDTPQGPSSKVKVHYTGYLVDGTKFVVFDGVTAVPPAHAVSAKATALRRLSPAGFFGDSESDAQAAKSAAVPFFAVSTGQRTADFLADAGIRDVFDSLAAAWAGFQAFVDLENRPSSTLDVLTK